MPGLNDYQRHTILSGFRDVHHRLAELESTLVQSLAESPFFQYINDLAPTERKVIQDYFVRIREAMRTLLHEAEIPLNVRRTSLRWALQGGLNFLDSAVSDLAPERLTGYGELSEEGRGQVEHIQQELHRLIDGATAYLRQGLGRDLGQPPLAEDLQELRQMESAPGEGKNE